MSEPRNEPIKGFIVLLAIIVGLWVLYWILANNLLGNWQDRGLFGDMFGSVNALFSGAALAGVIYTIFLQRRELQLQRQELVLTRDELKRTAEAQEKSEEALRDQHNTMMMTLRVSAISIMLEADRREIEALTRRGTLNRVEQQYKQSLEERIGELRSNLTKSIRV